MKFTIKLRKQGGFGVIEPGKESQIGIRLDNMGELYSIKLKSSDSTKYEKIKWLKKEGDTLEIPETFFNQNKNAEVEKEWFIDNGIFTTEPYSKEQLESAQIRAQEKANANMQKKVDNQKKGKRRKRETILSGLFDKLIGIGIVAAIVLVVGGLMYVGYQDEKKDKLVEQQIEEQAKDRSNYVRKDLEWYERQGTQAGFDRNNPVFVKIPLLVVSYEHSNCYVYDNHGKKEHMLYMNNSSVGEKIRDYYYNNEPFYAYCQVKSGLLYCNYVDTK